MGTENRSLEWSDLHSQFAFSGAKILRMSILLRPWEVSRMTSGATPISFPTLQTDCQRAARYVVQYIEAAWGFNLRMPVLHYCIC